MAKKVGPHEQAHLDDVAAQPEDDTPRLVSADWLDDHAQLLPPPDTALTPGVSSRAA